MMAREEEEDREPEITLSTTSLLGLFLGLVLVCGVFFGFGYSMGRRATVNSPAAAAGTESAGDQDSARRQIKHPGTHAQDLLGETPTSALADESSSLQSSAPEASPIEPAASTAPVPLPDVETPPQKVPRKIAQAAPPVMPVKRTAKQPAKTTGTGIEAGQAMVQVAAVVHQEDADVLVSALRKRGYSVVVRNEPQDKLLHVQVGPFATRVQANAMKQKLASDGYNAIIKQ